MKVFYSDEAPHGHMEMLFQDTVVHSSSIIWEEGRGFEMA